VNASIAYLASEDEINLCKGVLRGSFLVFFFFKKKRNKKKRNKRNKRKKRVTVVYLIFIAISFSISTVSVFAVSFLFNVPELVSYR